MPSVPYIHWRGTYFLSQLNQFYSAHSPHTSAWANFLEWSLSFSPLLFHQYVQSVGLASLTSVTLLLICIYHSKLYRTGTKLLLPLLYCCKLHVRPDRMLGIMMVFREELTLYFIFPWECSSYLEQVYLPQVHYHQVFLTFWGSELHTFQQ